MSTPVCALVTIAVAMPVAKAWASSACCTSTGLAWISAANWLVIGLKVRKRLPLNTSRLVIGTWV